MNAAQKQKGAALAIVTVLLVFALLGLMGWIAYDRFFGADTQQSQAEQTSAGVKNETDSQSLNYDLVISEFGVGGTYNTDLDTLTYTAESKNSATLFSKVLRSGECEGNIGVISAYEPSEMVNEGIESQPQEAKAFFSNREANDWTEVEGTFYLYTSPQSPCGEDVTSANDAVERARAFVLSLQSTANE